MMHKMKCPDPWGSPGLCAAHRQVVVAVPAKDEAEELAACLLALAGQQGARPDAVVLCLNNCTDDSAARVRAVADRLPFALHVLEVTLPPERASAGWARRIAMDRAAQLAGPEGILLTTDADGRVASDWLQANLAAIGQGADAVAGRADIEPLGARLIPPHLHALDARECHYAALLDEIAALVDPDPIDPWPRHTEHSGASIAVTVEAYHRAGGIPPVELAEDRAFFDALQRIDARIRHAPEARVVVSARIEGRAPGGMADTIRQRIACMDEHLDDRLEPAVDAYRRLRLRVRLRHAWRDVKRRGSVGLLAARLGLPVASVQRAIGEAHFGAAWGLIEHQSPTLSRRRVPYSALETHTARAVRLRDWLHAADELRRAADPIDTAALAAAAPSSIRWLR